VKVSLLMFAHLLLFVSVMCYFWSRRKDWAAVLENEGSGFCVRQEKETFPKAF
jgi:hypothetical protein